jgi:uncharacterized membrane protein YphA (DoxX/SURF4 family)
VADHQGETVITRIMQSRWLSLLVRVILGMTFIYASWSKIADPPGFAEMIWNYRILPDLCVNSVAIVLPWLELLSGLALISGLLRKGAALLVGTMLIVFIIALSADLARGIAIECGCFPDPTVAKTAAELFTGMRLDLFRDTVLLLLSLQVLFSIPAAERT